MLEARNKLEEYVEKYKHLKNPQVKEFRAVILRDLSLLDAREKGESSFDNAITKLTEAGKLLENLKGRRFEKTKKQYNIMLIKYHKDVSVLSERQMRVLPDTFLRTNHHERYSKR